ncbi:MAG: hypothetical protein QW290_09010 [Sulfolobales archaeon]
MTETMEHERDVLRANLLGLDARYRVAHGEGSEIAFALHLPAISQGSVLEILLVLPLGLFSF